MPIQVPTVGSNWSGDVFSHSLRFAGRDFPQLTDGSSAHRASSADLLPLGSLIEFFALAGRMAHLITKDRNSWPPNCFLIRRNSSYDDICRRF